MLATALLAMACGGGASGGGDGSSSSSASFGTYLKPFAADSPWNSRPLSPVLGTATIPADVFYPAVSGGAYSAMFALASSSDSAQTVYGIDGATINLVYTAAASVTLPRWPSSAIPASGTDGHLDILDPVTGIIHSFWKLQKATTGTYAGQWMASQYTRSTIDGRGWGDPALYYQGSRAVGVPTIAGIIRTSEISDGDTLYRHPLAMSLTYSGLSADPTFVFPATAADGDAAATNEGSIPEGSLLMLPSSFDTSVLSSAKLRKVAETLKVYGARAVDRNVGTPFLIYVEGVTDTFGLHSGYADFTGTWSNTCAAELDSIRAALRPLESCSGWVSGEGVTFTDFNRKLRMVAGMGSVVNKTLDVCTYNPMLDRIEVENASTSAKAGHIQDHIKAGVTPTWTAGKTYRFSVSGSSNEIQVTFSLFYGANGDHVNAGTIGSGQTVDLVAPSEVWTFCDIGLSVPAGVQGWVKVSAVEL